MQKSTVILFLKRLSKRDWREFRKFVRSPFYNQREDILNLFDYLDISLNSLSFSVLDRKTVFSKVYPNENYDDKKLRHSNSVLLRLLKRYLSTAEFEKDSLQQQQYLYKSLREKDLDIFSEKELISANNFLENSSFRNSDFYFQKYQLGMDGAIFTMAKKRSGKMNFQSTADQLTISYISSLLRLSCNIQSHRTMSSQEYDLKLLPEILTLVESREHLKVPAVILYYHCYKAIEDLDQGNFERSEINFEQLKESINLHWRLFPASEIRGIYLFAINYCIKRMNRGERQFIRTAFELFRDGLKNKTLLEEGILSSFTYKNITRLGIALSENQWVEQFLEDYKKYLYPRERENTWRYNLAYFYFQQQKYTEAMQLLLQVDFKDVLNNLDARRMLLKSYFELNEFNALSSLLESFARYIRRQKEIGYHKENNLNLIRIVKKIIEHGVLNKKVSAQFKEEIEETTRIAEREWLLEKVS